MLAPGMGYHLHWGRARTCCEDEPRGKGRIHEGRGVGVAHPMRSLPPQANAGRREAAQMEFSSVSLVRPLRRSTLVLLVWLAAGLGDAGAAGGGLTGREIYAHQCA